jgi:hypothetical protein
MLGYDPRIASKAPGQPITRAGPQEAILAFATALQTLLLDAFCRRFRRWLLMFLEGGQYPIYKDANAHSVHGQT